MAVKITSIFRDISIHAPREGSDVGQLLPGGADAISIHAPREGSDCRSILFLFPHCDFNPRSP